MDFEPFPQQRTAIESPLGPVLVVAGPGAGKTYCLIRRIEHLIDELGLPPERICAVTFTNKAAEEVTARLHQRLGPRADLVTRGTLHSLCLAIVREHAEAAGLRRGFGVADEDYQLLLLRRLRVYPQSRRHQLLNLFGRRRLQGYSLSEGDDALFDSYLSLLRERNLVDFDDIISLTDQLFIKAPEIADWVAARWDYLLVDEFQDLDPAQYRILKRLAATHRNIFAVGDDEQSIFSWRGSDPRIIWRFGTEFGVKEIVLDKNCRCSRQIFTAARRLMRENPELFHKTIEADRESRFAVEAYEFSDDVAEASWLLAHLAADRESSSLGWGDYALLYRKHEVGKQLENRLVAAGMPCRLARGRSLLDDPVIAYVVASLRVVSAPADPVAIEAFAQRMLPASLLAEVRTLAATRDGDFLAGMRAYARGHPSDHPDTKKAWRFVYHVENLRALHESHDTLAGLVEELLSQRVRPYENRLEEHYEELEDPEVYPGAAELAGRLAGTLADGGQLWIVPARGKEIALRGMLLAAGLPLPVRYLCEDAASGVGGADGETATGPPRPGDLVLDPHVSAGPPLVVALFKALQLIHSREFGEVLRDYVAFDLETTDLDPGRCEIIEVGAAKVRGGQIVEGFHSLVRCRGPISPAALEIHGYSEKELQGAPTLEDVWPRFRSFVGDLVLVAHNGHSFDVPVLKRSVQGFAGVEDLVFFDTLPLARSLFRESARLADLAERFGVDPGRAHHALDDALTLARVFQRLSEWKRLRARKAALVNLLDYVGLGLALESRRRLGAEEQLLFDLAVPYALGRFSDCLDFYLEERELTSPGAPELDEVIKRLGGRATMERIRAQRSPAERYPTAVARLRSLIEVSKADTLDESVRRLLDRVALSTSEGAEADPHRINLLTLHSTKGLEFSRVYIVGVEDYQLPGYYAAVENRRPELEEARRLLYVGMTRAKDRLVLTRCDTRRDRPSGGSIFLNEIGLAPVRP